MDIISLQFILMIGAGVTAVISMAELQDSQQFILPKEGSLTDFISTDNSVSHMEADQFIVGNILFLDGQSLQTNNGSTTDRILGSAYARGYVEGIGSDVRIHSLGFHQISADQVVVADYGNNCLRLVHRVTRQTSPYAGNCTHSGYTDGIHALFYHPAHIITDNFRNDSTEGKILIITDSGNNALREINTKTREVSTLIQSHKKLSGVWGITQDSVTGDLFLTVWHGIVRFIYGTQTLIHMTGSYTTGDIDGSFSEALFNNPRGLALLANDTILVADAANSVMRLVDLTTETISTICTGNRGKMNGRFNVCELTDPHSLLVVGDTLYCGENYGIRMVRGQTIVQAEQPKNTDNRPAGQSTMAPERPKHTIIWISASVCFVLVIGIIVVVVIWTYKRRSRNHTQGDVHLTPLQRGSQGGNTSH